MYVCLYICTEELYKKDLHDPDNHDGVITHLEPDILECEVMYAFGSITTNKASGGDGIPGELFQILKDDAVKVLQSLCQQIWKTQQWPQDWKHQFSFQSQRKVMQRMLKYRTITLISLTSKVKVKVAQSCPTLCNLMDFTVNGILQARILEWVAFPFSRDLPNPGIEPSLPYCRQILYQLSHREAPC